MFGLAPLPRSLEASLRDARDKQAAVRVSAVGDLARHAEEPDGERAREELAHAVTSDVSAQVRGAAALALADAKVGIAIEALIGALRDTHLHVRQMALIALGEVGEPGDARLFGALQIALEDESPALRFQALIAFSRLFAERAEGALLGGVRDPDSEVRHVSLRLLEERATSQGGGMSPREDVLSTAREALDDDVPAVRLVAAILLAKAGERSGAGVIAEMLNHARAKIDDEDEHAAIGLAAELPIQAAVPGLRRRAWGMFGVGRHRFAHEALIALARMGDPRARAYIVRGLAAWTRDARTFAVVAAGRAGLKEARHGILAMKADATRAEPSAVAEALTLLDAL